MDYIVVLVGCSFIVPIIMIVFGSIFKMGIPHKINKAFGYRTSMSMKNLDTWTYAHLYCGKMWFILGFTLFFITVFIELLCFYIKPIVMDWLNIGIIIAQCMLILLTIWAVERKLKEAFDENGNRRITDI